MFFTVYKTTNHINGKFYIGVHKTNDPLDEYLGSGLALKNAIEKHGIENFSKEILHTYKYEKVAYRKEAEIVNEGFVNRTDTYNLKLGGSGGGTFSTKEKVIEQFKEVHGNRYDYSLVDYVHNKTKVKIICPSHGVFEQNSDSHKRGQGCPKCKAMSHAINKTLSTEKVIEQFKEVHGNRYDYSKIAYSNFNEKVEIICKIHGSFWQRPTVHNRGHGCLQCSRISKPLLTVKQILIDFKNKHGEKYDYSKVKYLGTTKKVEIICKKHGSFWQRASNHKNGQGCPKCVIAEQSKNQTLSTKKVIEQFKEAHSDRYDYSKVKYLGTTKKVEIICKIHGVFFQKPSNHKSGQGCPKCKSYKRKKQLTLAID